MICRSLFLFVSVVALASPLAANSTTFGYFNVTNNSGIAGTLAQQLFVDVSDESGGIVGFKFRNEGTITSSITTLYFDDVDPTGLLSNLYNIPGTNPATPVESSTGVSFVAATGNDVVKPPSLPGGAPYDFTKADVVFAAESVNPAVANGVNNCLTCPGEYVKIFFELASGSSYGNIIAALTDGSFRIGLRTQGVQVNGSGDYSEGFINTPEPGFYGLLSLCLGGLFFFRRRLRPLNPLD